MSVGAARTLGFVLLFGGGVGLRLLADGMATEVIQLGTEVPRRMRDESDYLAFRDVSWLLGITGALLLAASVRYYERGSQQSSADV